MQHAKQFYIDGKWVDPVTPKLLDVIDPSTEEAYTQIAAGSAADVDRAVAAARTAFASFGHSSRKERLDLLRAILAEYNKRRSELGDAISQEMGAPLQFARDIQAGRGTAHLERMIEVLEAYPFEEQVRAVSAARYLVSGHGAGLTNMLFMRPGSHVRHVRFGEGVVKSVEGGMKPSVVAIFPDVGEKRILLEFLEPA